MTKEGVYRRWVLSAATGVPISTLDTFARPPRVVQMRISDEDAAEALQWLGGMMGDWQPKGCTYYVPQVCDVTSLKQNERQP